MTADPMMGPDPKATEALIARPPLMDFDTVPNANIGATTTLGAYMRASATWEAPAERPMIAAPFGPGESLVYIAGWADAAPAHMCPVAITRVWAQRGPDKPVELLYAVHSTGRQGIRCWLAGSPAGPLGPEARGYSFLLFEHPESLPAGIPEAIAGL